MESRGETSMSTDRDFVLVTEAASYLCTRQEGCEQGGELLAQQMESMVEELIGMSRQGGLTRYSFLRETSSDDEQEGYWDVFQRPGPSADVDVTWSEHTGVSASSSGAELEGAGHGQAELQGSSASSWSWPASSSWAT